MRAWRATSGRLCDQAPDRRLQGQEPAQDEEGSAWFAAATSICLPLRLHLAVRRLRRALTAYGLCCPLTRFADSMRFPWKRQPILNSGIARRPPASSRTRSHARYSSPEESAGRIQTRASSRHSNEVRDRAQWAYDERQPGAHPAALGAINLIGESDEEISGWGLDVIDGGRRPRRRAGRRRLA